MRILLVVHTFLPESVGGTEVHTYELARDLQARHDVAVLYRVFSPDRPEFELSESRYQGLPVFRLVNNFTWSQGPLFDYFCPGAEPAFQQVLDRFQPDLVHFQHLGGGLSTSYLSLAAARGLPTVLTLHDYWCLCPLSQLLTLDEQRCPGPEGGLRCIRCRRPTVYAPPLDQSLLSLRAEIARWGWRRTVVRLPGYVLARLLAPWLDRRPLPYAPDTVVQTTYLARNRYFQGLFEVPDAVISPSLFLRRVFERWGVPAGRITHVCNGVDPRGLQLPLVPGKGRLRLAYIGAIQSDKGLGVLVEAMGQLKGAPVELRIYGNDRATPEVARYAAELRQKAEGAQVGFMGLLSRDRLGEALADTDALVLPSLRYENCPVSILEAFYARVPVIASDGGGMAELVQDDGNGLLFQVGNADDLAGKIRRLIADPSALERLRRGTRRPWPAGEVSRRIERIYAQVLELRQQGRCGVDIQRAVAASTPAGENEP